MVAYIITMVVYHLFVVINAIIDGDVNRRVKSSLIVLLGGFIVWGIYLLCTIQHSPA